VVGPGPERRIRVLRMTPDNIWFDDCDKAVAKAMAQWLQQTVNIKRPIQSLTNKELVPLARHTVDTWIAMQSRRAAEQKPYAKDVIGLW
jgi:hypothetical protein